MWGQTLSLVEGFWSFLHVKLSGISLHLQLNLLLQTCTSEVLWKRALTKCIWALCNELHVNVDALHPHVSAGRQSRFAAFRPEKGVSFIQLLTTLSAFSISASSLFSHWVWRRSDICETNCYRSFESIRQIKKSPVIHFKSTDGCFSFYIRGWLQGICLLSNQLGKIVCLFAEVYV